MRVEWFRMVGRLELANCTTIQRGYAGVLIIGRLRHTLCPCLIIIIITIQYKGQTLEPT